MLLEVCANSYQSAVNAQQAGAHRIELCEDLNVGGLTPNSTLFEQVLAELFIPVFALIRPRRGDFHYSESEFEQMKTAIQKCKELGAKGIVSGVLKDDKAIDLDRTNELITLSRPLPFTFHRAFDEVPDPLEGLKQLIELGVDRVLTSGQKPTAEDGIELLKRLHEKAENRIAILPGSGINPTNAHLFRTAKFAEIHASASKQLGDTTVSDPDTIKGILNAI